MVNPWPVPKFHFLVTWRWGKMTCEEVCGLDIDASMAETLNDVDAKNAPIDMPGMKRGGNVILKNVKVKSGPALRDWLSLIRTNAIRPASVTVSLIFEADTPSMIWVLSNAWPLEVAGVDATAVNADDAMVAIESITIVHDGVTTLKC